MKENIFIETIYTNYNEDNGVSEAIINTDLGLIKGKAKLNPEDEKIKSKFAGCQYAETRAIIKYMKKKQKEATKNINLFNHLLKELEHTKDYYSTHTFIKIIKNNIEHMEKIKNNFITYENSLNKQLNKTIAERPIFIKKLEEVHNNKKGE